MEAKTPHRKMKIGIVVSDKMEKTISVRVTRHAMHPSSPRSSSCTTPRTPAAWATESSLPKLVL